jgi:hypothetical protein
MLDAHQAVERAQQQPLGNGVVDANSAVTGDHCPYSEAKMPCMVVISCWWLVTIEWASATAGGY